MATPGIVHGTVQGVEATTWKGALVSIEFSALDRKGRPVTGYVDIRVSPEQVEQGLHNAYRSLIGKEVYAPVSFGLYQKDGAGRAYEQVELSGLPLPLHLVQDKPATAPAPVRPTQASA